MAIAHSRESFYRLIFSHPRRKQILVEGDSWVSHPLPRASNLCVKLNKYLRGRCNIYSMGEIGHLASDTMSGGQLKTFIDALRAPQHDISLIFYSAGGNDILAHDEERYQLHKLVKNAGGSDFRKYIVEDLWTEVLGKVIDAYNTLIKTRDTYRPGCPIVTHNYDFIYPRNEGVDLIKNNIIGPWVYKAMLRAGITNEKVMREIIMLMLADFNTELKNLVAQNNDFVLVNTQGTLTELEDWGIEIDEWDDEIHPNSLGFGRLMEERIGPVIKQLLK